MRPLTMAALVLLAADETEPPDPKAGKQSGPLKVRLVARKAEYALDRQGLSADDYRDAVKGGKVAPPAVDLVLELTNTSKEDVTVRVAGSSPVLTFHLKGPKGRVVTLDPGAGRKIPRERKKVQMVTIAPGKKHEVRITKLDSTDVSYPRAPAFWTEPGAYTLSVDLRTRVGTGKAGKITTLSSQEVKLTVKLK
jgi:hypothetical protein